MSFSLIWKLGMVALVVGTIFFLSYIFPNIRTPKWRRKIISAKYLRDRQHFDLADQVLEGAMKEFPAATDVYHVYYQYYSTPEDMKKIYDNPNINLYKGNFDRPAHLNVEMDCSKYQQEIQQEEYEYNF